MSAKHDYTPIMVEVGLLVILTSIFIAGSFLLSDKAQNATKSAPVMDSKEHKLFVMQSKPESVKK